MAKKIYIGGEMASVAQGNIVASSSAIMDYNSGKTQAVLNESIARAIVDIEQRMQNMESAVGDIDTIKSIVNTEDLDGNGIPDGEDRLNRIEQEATATISNNDIKQVWDSIFNNTRT